MFLLKWLLSVKNIRHLKNLLKIRYLPFASVNMTIRLSRERPNWFLGQPQGRAPSSGRACSQAHSSFSSPEPVVSWSRGLVGYKLSRVALGTRMVKAFFLRYFSAAIFFAKKPFAEFFTNIHVYHALREWKRKDMCRPISRKDVQPWGRPCCYTRLRDSRVTPARAAAKETTHTGGEWQDWAFFTKT